MKFPAHKMLNRHPPVAPCAGAWIEICWPEGAGKTKGSPPARGRGLKCARRGKHTNYNSSPPARGRGLKFFRESHLSPLEKSPPARGRGLKLTETLQGMLVGGSPLRGGVD